MKIYYGFLNLRFNLMREIKIQYIVWMTMESHSRTSHSRMATQISPLNSSLSISITGGPHLYPNIRKIIRKIQKSGYPKRQNIRIRIRIRFRNWYWICIRILIIIYVFISVSDYPNPKNLNTDPNSVGQYPTRFHP